MRRYKFQPNNAKELFNVNQVNNDRVSVLHVAHAMRVNIVDSDSNGEDESVDDDPWIRNSKLVYSRRCTMHWHTVSPRVSRTVLWLTHEACTKRCIFFPLVSTCIWHFASKRVNTLCVRWISSSGTVSFFYSSLRCCRSIDPGTSAAAKIHRIRKNCHVKYIPELQIGQMLHGENGK